MITLKIEGMSCSHCKKRVEEAIRSVKGVTDVKVDLNSGIAEISGFASPKDLISAVIKAGYNAQIIEEKI